MYCISISHKRAPAHIRERYAFSKEERKEFSALLLESGLVSGCLVLSTCNRSELYVTGIKDAKKLEGMEALISSLADYKKVERAEFKNYLNLYEKIQAERHLFKVCGGLESKILGEDEILRQVKEAYEEAKEAKTTDFEMNLVFQRAIASAKKIKTDTELSRVPVSITTLAANEVFALEKEGQKTVLLLGLSGKIGGAIAKNLLCKPNVHVIGTVREESGTAGFMAQSERLTIVPYHKRYEYVNKADVIISATSSPHYTIVAKEFFEAASREKEVLILDLSMPRDVDPSIKENSNVVVHNIDYFDTVSKENSNIKLSEMEHAMAIMEQELEELEKELVFHRYYDKIDDWKKVFEEVPFEKIVFAMKKQLDLEPMKVVLETFEKMEQWVKGKE